MRRLLCGDQADGDQAGIAALNSRDGERGVERALVEMPKPEVQVSARPQRANALRDISTINVMHGNLTMRCLLVLVAICFSTTAFAQSAQPNVGNKPVVRVKPKEPSGCKLVGTVRGTKLWAGDCVGVELLKGPTETQTLPEPATTVVPPGQKE